MTREREREREREIAEFVDNQLPNQGIEQKLVQKRAEHKP